MTGHPKDCLCSPECAAATIGMALVGSWPSQVAAWGKSAIGAYVAELEARGVTPEQALIAIRSWRPADPSKDFPPSASALADFARRDPSAPTPPEALQLLQEAMRARAPYAGPQPSFEIDRAREAAVWARAEQLHPLLAAWMRSLGWERLKTVDLSEWNAYVGAQRHELARSFEQFREAHDTREIHALVVGRRADGLAKLDPLSALGRGGPLLGSGS